TITYLSDTGCLEIQGASLSGMFPMAFIYVLYCAFDFDQNVKDNSGWLSIASMGVLIAVILAIVNKRYLEYDLSFKNNRMKLLRR
ncbi:hypothetical protein LIY57_26435, partial [Escherichia coli]|nr:hypothetical protein [Escherichia coli]